MIEFNRWPKIKRYANETVTITEKIDGTNGQFYITEDSTILTGARNGWVTVDDDNFGFAKFIQERKDLILNTFPKNKRFYGEFYGKGINRGYGLDHKRFVLFNPVPWEIVIPEFDCVPILVHETSVNASSRTLTHLINISLDLLDLIGSSLVLGYRNPEGIIATLGLTGAKYKAYCKENKDK